MSFNRKNHWENIYQTKELNEVSWYQPTPETSLSYIQNSNLPLDAKIIDIGGGDSFLVDHLLKLGYSNITVVDISGVALERAKTRLANDASKVTWITTDVTEFEPDQEYDFWHDRAAFHFLTDEDEIEKYLKTVQKHLSENGIFVLGTFSENGPEKCSGIPIKQYSESSITSKVDGYFNKINCIKVDHKTPFNTVQNFIFCSFRK